MRLSLYNKEFLCITHTFEHNYISSSSTLGLQLHVSALYVGYLQVVTQIHQDRVYLYNHATNWCEVTVRKEEIPHDTRPGQDNQRLK